MKKNFSKVVEKIDKGISFEIILNSLKYEMVECCNNEVYYDDDFEKFLSDFNVDSFIGLNYIMFIDNTTGKIYNVEYKFIKNRFDDTLSDEIIMTFSKNTFYKMK